MPTGPIHSGDMSQNSARGPVHPSGVQATAPSTKTRLSAAQADDDPRLTPVAAPVPTLTRALDPAARQSKRLYDGLSASSAGLELGIAVGLGALFGVWLDGRLGTQPWLMVVFLVLGLVAGFRGVLRAVARAEKAATRG